MNGLGELLKWVDGKHPLPFLVTGGIALYTHFLRTVHITNGKVRGNALI
jgi:hypothetical protein